MSHRAAREACRRTGVADTLAGSPIGHALPAAPRLAPPRGRPQAHNACARHRQIPQTGGAKDPRPSPPRGLGPRAAPAPAPAAYVAAAHFFFGEVCAKGRPGRPRGKPGFRLGSPAPGSCWLPLRRHPRGSAGVRKGRILVRGSTCPRGTYRNVSIAHPCRHGARPHRPLAARSGLLPSLIGSTYFRSRSQGKKIQVSCDTSVMKVWHIGAPCGLA